MRFKIVKLWWMVAGIVLFWMGTVYADGVIIVERPVEVSRIIARKPVQSAEALSVKYHHVNVDINSGVATTSIDQVFKNDYNSDLEGTYIFPLPEDVTILEFAMYMNGKKVTGKILNKDDARRIYEDIVRRMKDPGLLEYIGRNMFKARVYPVPAKGEVRVEIKYSQTVSYDAGICKYVYPLNTEKFSPRPPEEVAISVNVKSKVPIKSIYSPTHEVDTKVEEYSASCGYEAKNVKPGKDFVVYYTVSEKDLGLNLLTYKETGKDGFFALMLSPGELEGKSIDKDIVFVFDTSGSMSGDKIKQAREALRFSINSLNKGDRFNILQFATGVTSYKDILVRADGANVKEALEFINRIEARGGTNINEALLNALRNFKDSTRPRMVVFLTDGEPTVGVTEMKDILKNANQDNTEHARVFVFGVGNDVNSHLLDSLAKEERGVSEYVVPGEDIEVKVSSFYRKISEPVLADIRLDYGKIKVTDIYPKTLPDIFKGTQLVLFGRYSGDGASAITLTGKTGGKEEKFVYEDRFTKENKENDFIPRIWATRKIGYLTSEIRLHGENRELVDEIVCLSKEYGIMTHYTSFLVLEKEQDYSRWGIDAVSALKMAEEVMSDKKDFNSVSGAGAVRSSKSLRKMERSKVAQESMLETVKYIGGKTFYNTDNIWIDAEYEEGMKIKNVKYLSSEYFELLKQKPGLGKYFSIARKVQVVYDGVCYRVTE